MTLNNQLFEDRKNINLSILLTLINCLLISFSDLNVFNAFFYTIFLFIVISFILGIKKFLLINYTVLSFYILLALLLYWAQFYLIPGSYGFSGDYGGMGTDDSRYYAGVAYNTNFIPTYAFRFIGMKHSFVDFLKVLYPFNIKHPLSIIIPNLIGITFIPHFTREVSKDLIKNEKYSKIAFFLVLLCPIILSHGLILMRDGWTAFLTILGFYFIIRKQLISFIITLLILIYIRAGSGLVLACMPFFYFKDFIFSGSKFKQSLKLFFFGFIVLITIFYGLPVINEYLALKGFDGLERQSFVEGVIKKIDDNSVIYKIYSLPIYLKLPLGFIFFLLLPFLNPRFYFEGILNLRGILFTTIMPLLLMLYFKYFVTGFMVAFKNKDRLVKKIYYLYFFAILLISQASVQPRHKTTIMPIFYILVAYGMLHNKKGNNFFGIFFAFLLFLIQIYMLI